MRTQHSATALSISCAARAVVPYERVRTDRRATRATVRSTAIASARVACRAVMANLLLRGPREGAGTPPTPGAPRAWPGNVSDSRHWGEAKSPANYLETTRSELRSGAWPTFDAKPSMWPSLDCFADR